MRSVPNRVVAGAAVAAWCFAPQVQAIILDVNNPASISNAASQIAYDLVSYYTGNITGTGLGLLPAPYYWWEAGAMWGSLVGYWHYTNDETYNAITSQALLANIGPAQDFIVPTQQFDEGNDDQAFWGIAAMSAAETSFPAPPSSYPSWVQLVEALWNTQVYRWDMSTCGGGLKWQFYTSNAGYNYKNAVSNGAFFQLAARLLRYTGNTTYLTWAEKSWDWSTNIGLVDPTWYSVFDGTDDTINCTEINHTQWSYNVGIYLLGAATMYNYTNGSAIWQERVDGLLQAASTFFSPGPNATSIMYETSCETISTCNTDQQSFKAYLASTMYKTTQMAPYTSGVISNALRISAEGAAASCSGSITTPKGLTSYACGSRWYINGFDNVYGVGEQLTALEVIQGLLVNSSSAPIYGNNVGIDTVASAGVTAVQNFVTTATAYPASTTVVVVISSSAVVTSDSSTSSAAPSSSTVVVVVVAASSTADATSTPAPTETQSTVSRISGSVRSYGAYKDWWVAFSLAGISIAVFWGILGFR